MGGIHMTGADITLLQLGGACIATLVACIGALVPCVVYLYKQGDKTKEYVNTVMKEQSLKCKEENDALRAENKTLQEKIIDLMQKITKLELRVASLSAVLDKKEPLHLKRK